MKWRLLRVTGNSMLPTLSDGDFILVQCKPRRIRCGDVIVADHPEFGAIIKRVKHRLPGAFQLEGDNPQASTSTERIGPVLKSAITGRALLAICRKGLRRL